MKKKQRSNKLLIVGAVVFILGLLFLVFNVESSKKKEDSDDDCDLDDCKQEYSDCSGREPTRDCIEVFNKCVEECN